MSTGIVAAAPPEFTHASPLARYFRSAARWLLVRFTRTAHSAERALVLEDRVAIGPRKSLVVVRCHGQRFLVATAGDTIGPVIEIAPRKSPAQSSSRSERRTHKEHEA